MGTRIALSRLSAVAALAASSACDPDPTGNQGVPRPNPFCKASGCVGLVVEGVFPGMLKGDTMRVYTRSDSGFAAPVVWEVEGAAEMVPQSQIVWTEYLGEGRGILIRGVSAGNALVSATHPNRTAKATITVADSSAIRIIGVFVYRPTAPHTTLLYGTTMIVGDSLWADGILRDEHGNEYAGRPESWTISDTTVATIRVGVTPPQYDAPQIKERIWIRGKSPGSVDVTASFLGVQQTVRITVL